MKATWRGRGPSRSERTRRERRNGWRKRGIQARKDEKGRWTSKVALLAELTHVGAHPGSHAASEGGMARGWRPRTGRRRCRGSEEENTRWATCARSRRLLKAVRVQQAAQASSLRAVQGGRSETGPRPPRRRLPSTTSSSELDSHRSSRHCCTAPRASNPTAPSALPPPLDPALIKLALALRHSTLDPRLGSSASSSDTAMASSGSSTRSASPSQTLSTRPTASRVRRLPPLSPPRHGAAPMRRTCL